MEQPRSMEAIKKNSGYSAFERMREKNIKEFDIDGPTIPERFIKQRIWKIDAEGNKNKKPDFDDITELEEKAVAFIRKSCEGLRFKKDDYHRELKDLDGKSLKPGQVPYNFEMDMDRRCLEVAIHRFLESGMAKDAFDVYFCYLEMFVGSYGKTKKMIEMLSEFETNASSLLMKHRDHYSHSVYVFLIGLAFYQESKSFREAYKKAYGGLFPEELNRDDDHDCAAHFLQFWGLTALFHDVGYPFELTFEQVKSYFGDTIKFVPFVSFNMNNFQNPKAEEVCKEAEQLKKKIAVRFEELCEEKDNDVLEKEKENLNGYKKEAKKLMEAFSEEERESKFRALSEVISQNPQVPSVWYQSVIIALNEFVRHVKELRSKDIDKLKRLLPKDESSKDLRSSNMNAFLAAALYSVLGEDYAYYDNTHEVRFKGYDNFVERNENLLSCSYLDYLYDVLCRKPEHPESFDGFIDHAYFSTIALLNTLIRIVDVDVLNEMYTQALTAILLHNSFYKYSVTNVKNDRFNSNKHFNLSRHPLAYLLMLCDELQCWDRTAYGQNSRGEVHPFDCELHFEGDKITATYLFDEERFKGDGTDAIKAEYKGKKGTFKKLDVEKGKEKSEFLQDIENIISINGDESFGELSTLQLEVNKQFKVDRRFRGSYLSTSNFIHMYKFAIYVHQMNHLEEKKSPAFMEEEFENMSLEYKINHISRAKKFAKILNNVGCFYSDKPMDLKVKTEFQPAVLESKIGPVEHERWCWEHYVMGWRYISKDKLAALMARFPQKGKCIRECIKRHPDMFEIKKNPNGDEVYEKQDGMDHFFELDEAHGHGADTKEKDTRSTNNLLKVLAREDGVKVYEIRQPDIEETTV